MSSDKEVRIFKVIFGEVIKKYPLRNDEINLDELLVVFQRMFTGLLKPEDKISIKYLDEGTIFYIKKENDWVNIDDNDDLLFALSRQDNFFKFKIVKKAELEENLTITDSSMIENAASELKRLGEILNSFCDKLDKISISKKLSPGKEEPPFPHISTSKPYEPYQSQQFNSGNQGPPPPNVSDVQRPPVPIPSNMNLSNKKPPFVPTIPPISSDNTFPSDMYKRSPSQPINQEHPYRQPYSSYNPNAHPPQISSIDPPMHQRPELNYPYSHENDPKYHLQYSQPRPTMTNQIPQPIPTSLPRLSQPGPPLNPQHVPRSQQNPYPMQPPPHMYGGPRSYRPLNYPQAPPNQHPPQ